MKLSIVIPTHNRRHSLAQCLRSLAAQSFSAEEYEIIVVADGCTDGTEELLRSLKPACAFRWISQANLGQPAAMNAGVAAAIGDIVIFIDDDIVCGAELVAAHYEAHAQAERAVVLGPVVLHPASPRGVLRDLVDEWADAEFRRLSSQGASPSDLKLCANSSIERPAALRFPFDTSFKRIHEVEAGIRLWAEGYRPRFEPRAFAYEFYCKTPEEFLRDCRLLGKYEIMLAGRFPSFSPRAATARLSSGNWFQRALRKQLVLHAKLSEPLLRSMFSLASGLRGVPGFSGTAGRLLQARAGVAHLKGAMEEAGSWKKLEREFGARQ